MTVDAAAACPFGDKSPRAGNLPLTRHISVCALPALLAASSRAARLLGSAYGNSIHDAPPTNDGEGLLCWSGGGVSASLPPPSTCPPVVLVRGIRPSTWVGTTRAAVNPRRWSPVLCWRSDLRCWRVGIRRQVRRRRWARATKFHCPLGQSYVASLPPAARATCLGDRVRRCRHLWHPRTG